MTKVGYRPWEILHLDLSQPLPDLPGYPDWEGVLLFLWWHQIPLGELEIPASQLPIAAHPLLQRILPVITPTIGSHLLDHGFQGPLPGTFGYRYRDTAPDFSALMALHHPLSQLQAHWATATQETVSVIICTRDRPEPLARCLRSLQSLRTQPHEIVVVDNAPRSDATQNLMAQWPDVRYVREPRPGLSIARNTGIHAATGDLIAFTDDDVEVHPCWVEQLRPAFRDPAVMAMTGLILPAKLETEAEQVFQGSSTGFGWGYRPLTFGPQFFEEMKPLGVPVWRIGAGANMAFRRQIFDQVGGFDERLGAGASGCSEDSEFWYRILAAGWSCRYEPMAVVYHHHRADLTSLNQQMLGYMRGHVTALLIQAENHGHWGNIRRLAIALPRYYTRRFLAGCFYRFQGRYRTVFTEIRGCLEGVGYYLRHRQVPGSLSPSLPVPSPSLSVPSRSTSQS